MGDVLERAGVASGPVVTVSSHATAAEAVAAVGAAARYPTVVPILQARATRPHGIAAGEVLGSVDLTALAEGIDAGRIAADSPVLEHRGDPLPTVGIGETARAAVAAIGAHRAALVLRDGRAVALVDRADLDA